MIGSGGTELRISNAWAKVAGLGVVCLFGMIIALAFAGWKAAEIGGLFVGLGTLFAGVVYAVRHGEVVEAKTDRQTVQLDRIEKQTNGESVERLAAAVVAELRRQGIIR